MHFPQFFGKMYACMHVIADLFPREAPLVPRGPNVKLQMPPQILDTCIPLRYKDADASLRFEDTGIPLRPQ